LERSRRRVGYTLLGSHTWTRFLAVFRRHPVLPLFLLTTGVRVLLIPVFGDRTLDHEFGVIVPYLLEGRGYVFHAVTVAGQLTDEFLTAPQRVLPSAFMPPGYPYFLSAILWMFGNGPSGIVAVETIQALLAGLTCSLLYDIVRIKFSERTATLSGVVFAGYPLLSYSATQISAVNIYVPLNCLMVWCFLRGEQRRKLTDWTLGGLVLGCLILSRADVLLYVPLLLAWIWSVSRRSAATVAVVLMGASVFLGPWAVRNASVFGRVTPLTLSGGLSLWEGQNANATGTRSEYTDPKVRVPAELEAQLKALPITRDYEVERDRVFMRAALASIRRDPLAVLSRAGKKFVFYWAYYWGIEFTYPGATSVFYWLPWFLLLPLFVTGLWQTRHDFRKYLLFYIYFFMGTTTAMVFFVIPRYRLFILPFVFPFVVTSILRLSSTKDGHESRAGAP